MNQIMILGTFHMEGSCDICGEAQEGISSERRQLAAKEPELFMEISHYGNEAIKLDENMTVIDAYRIMNSAEYEENTKAHYVNYARIGVENDYYGLGCLKWQRR